MSNKPLTIATEKIAAAIFFLRGQRVMLDADLAKLYGIPTKVLLQAVRRNTERFPSDFMYFLTAREISNLRSQFVTSSWGGRRYRPHAFTEQGVAMLSSVLKSRRAIQMNIRIMRTFVRFKQFLLAHKELARRLEWLEGKVGKHDDEILAILEAIRQLMTVKETPKHRIGFHL